MKKVEQDRQAREELLHLLSLSGTMAGLSITGVTLFYSIGKGSAPTTLADEALASCALLFLLCTYAVFWALRSRQPNLAARLAKVADMMFALALTGMVAAGFLMVFMIL